jgi:hypothetical protein
VANLPADSFVATAISMCDLPHSTSVELSGSNILVSGIHFNTLLVPDTDEFAVPPHAERCSTIRNLNVDMRILRAFDESPLDRAVH